MLDFCFPELKALSHPGKLLKSEIGKTIIKAKTASIGPAFSHYAFDLVSDHPRPCTSSVFLPIPQSPPTNGRGSHFLPPQKISCRHHPLQRYTDFKLPLKYCHIPYRIEKSNSKPKPKFNGFPLKLYICFKVNETTFGGEGWGGGIFSLIRSQLTALSCIIPVLFSYSQRYLCLPYLSYSNLVDRGQQPILQVNE